MGHPPWKIQSSTKDSCCHIHVFAKNVLHSGSTAFFKFRITFHQLTGSFWFIRMLLGNQSGTKSIGCLLLLQQQVVRTDKSLMLEIKTLLVNLDPWYSRAHFKLDNEYTESFSSTWKTASNSSYLRFSLTAHPPSANQFYFLSFLCFFHQ